MNQTFNFTNINHTARIELSLSMNEYAVTDLIYHLSNNPTGSVQGWCYASKEFIGAQLSLTRKQIHIIIAKLIESHLVEKHPDTKHLKTTDKWYDKIIVTEREERLHTVTKGYTDSNQRLHQDSNQRLHNIDNTNKDNNNKVIAASPQSIPHKRKPPDKQTQLQRICYTLEDILQTSTVNWGKQGKALTMMLKANYTERQILWVIKQMAEDEYYEDKGFDLMTVANNIDKYKAKARRTNYAAPT